MIDIEKAKEEFERYTSKYDRKEEHIERKIFHTYRVVEFCEKIAIDLKMSNEEVQLAKLIGLLHDLARFDQYTIYQTFSDLVSRDHGEWAVQILEKDNYIRKYIEDEVYDDIIKKSIYNHNKYAIEKNVNSREATFCKIIRDADKLDIMYEAIELFWKQEKDKIEKEEISFEVFQDFMQRKIINNKDVKLEIDAVIRTIAFIYDYNYKKSYEIITDNDYINRIIDRFNFERIETKRKMELIREQSNDYINKKIQK